MKKDPLANYYSDNITDFDNTPSSPRYEHQEDTDIAMLQIEFYEEVINSDNENDSYLGFVKTDILEWAEEWANKSESLFAQAFKSLFVDDVLGITNDLNLCTSELIMDKTKLLEVIADWTIEQGGDVYKKMNEAYQDQQNEG